MFAIWVYQPIYQRSKEEFTNVSNYGRTIESTIGSRLRDLVQEDEGSSSTIRVAELKHKLRLAEQMADHICGKYRGLAEESNEEQSELHAMNQKMESVSNELQGAIGPIGQIQCNRKVPPRQ